MYLYKKEGKRFKPFKDALSIVHSRHNHFAILRLIKNLVLQVELSGHPADVHVTRILTGEDAHSVKVLVDHADAFAVKRVELFGIHSRDAACLRDAPSA